MKYFVTTIILFSILSLSAQVQIDFEDFAKTGENFIVAIDKFSPSQKIKIDNFKQGNTWNFAGLRQDDYDTIRFKPPLKTAFGQHIHNANIAKHFRFTEIYYQNISAKGLYEVGVIADYLHIDAAAFIDFTDNVLICKFPINEGDTYQTEDIINFKSAFGNTKYVGIDSIKSFITLKKQTEFFESSQLRTVLGTYEVLCEKTVVSKDIRTNKKHKYVHGSMVSTFWEPAKEFSSKVEYTIYRWYAKGEGIPVAEAIVNKRGYVEQISYKYEEPLTLSFNSRNPFCKGGKRGVIDLVVRGGIPDYKYEWSNGDSTENIKGLKAGTYKVKVTDNKGNQQEASHTLTQPSDTLILNIDIQQISCYGEEDGKLKATLIGGIPPYHFIWSTNEKTDSISGLRPKIYGLIARDENRCIITDSVTIYAPQRPLTVTSETQRVTCFDGNDGKATATPKGGTPPYFYKWDNGDTTQTATNLEVGKYRLTVTDSHGCTVQTRVNIDQPINPITAKFTIRNVSCYGGNDGEIKPLVMGGGGNFTYEWSNGATTEDIAQLLPGDYTLKITDKFGCQYFDMATVTQPEDSITITYEVENVLCYGGEDGKISVEVSGGTPDYNYKWSNKQVRPEIKGLEAKTYGLTVTDKNFCEARILIAVTQPKLPVGIYSNPQHVSCFGGKDGKIEASISGGVPPYTCRWNTGSTDSTIANLSEGKYWIEATDSNGCLNRKEYKIKAPENQLTAEVVVKDVSCFGGSDGSVFINPKGGVPEYFYKWKSGGDVQTLSFLEVGEYEVEITDQYGCKITKTATVNQPEMINLEVDYTSPSPGGNDGKIDVTISGGTKPYSLNWKNFGTDSPTLENIPKGTYILTVTDANRCQVEATYELEGE